MDVEAEDERGREAPPTYTYECIAPAYGNWHGGTAWRRFRPGDVFESTNSPDFPGMLDAFRLTEKPLEERPLRDTRGATLADAGGWDARILSTLAKLDPGNDEHWTDAGWPAVGAVKKILEGHGTDTTDVTRSMITNVAPDFQRPS